MATITSVDWVTKMETEVQRLTELVRQHEARATINDADIRDVVSQYPGAWGHDFKWLVRHLHDRLVAEIRSAEIMSLHKEDLELERDALAAKVERLERFASEAEHLEFCAIRNVISRDPERGFFMQHDYGTRWQTAEPICTCGLNAAKEGA